MSTPEMNRKASHELEAMLPHLREIVNETREGTVDAYASLYEARKRLGQIIAPLGAGVPSRQVKSHRWDNW